MGFRRTNCCEVTYFEILMVTIIKCNLVQGRCMDMVGISSFSLQRCGSPSLEIAALVRFPLDELHLLWMSKLPNLLLFIGGMIDINPSICINLNLVPIGVDSNQIKLQHTTSACTLYKYTYIYYIYMHRYIFYLYIHIHVLCLPSVHVYSFKIQNFIHQRAWRKSFPMTSDLEALKFRNAAACC